MKIGIWIALGIAVLIILYLFMNNKKNKATADAVIASIPPQSPPCVPFTQAQQDAEKRSAQAKCASKLLIPFVGPAQYTACIKNVSAELTPVNNC